MRVRQPNRLPAKQKLVSNEKAGQGEAPPPHIVPPVQTTVQSGQTNASKEESGSGNFPRAAYKVTTPSVWVILAVTLLLVFGTLFWAVFGRIQVNSDTVIKEEAPINYVIR